MKPQDVARAPLEDCITLDAGVAVRAEIYGARAATLAQLTALDLPVPPGVALSFACVRALAEGGALPSLARAMVLDGLVSVRASPKVRSWGGPTAILNIGLGAKTLPTLAATLGVHAAQDLYRRFVLSYALGVHGVDPDAFEPVVQRHLVAAAARAPRDLGAEALEQLTNALQNRFEEVVGQPFPQDPVAQLAGAAAAMSRAWNAASARILREARGAPSDAGLGLIVQQLILGEAPGLSGAGVFCPTLERTGAPVANGSFVLQAQGPEARAAAATPRHADATGLESLPNQALDVLQDAVRRAASGLGDAYQLDFTLSDGRVAILDAVPARRNTRASVRIAVDLVTSGAITRSEALLRVDPRNLIEHLHPQIDPAAGRDVFCTGLGASPGAATGRIVFSAEAAQAAAAQGEATILVRQETGPEDIRGMHAARGVLTVRGGMTSHAAVIARGIGLPCVVGAGDLRLDVAAGRFTSRDGRSFGQGAQITLDGTRGEVMAGAAAMIPPELGGAFAQLLEWADAARDIGVRANADTPAEARMARDFCADGLGLCRTEHMFYDEERIKVMRELILTDDPAERRTALASLLPMQRADFVEIFEIMRGLPVTIRLLDPPLHEFLPQDSDEMRAFAAATGRAFEDVSARAAELAEVNPMLGKRGVRLGITMPEIYDMQARAIFEAAIAVNRDARTPVVPEVMIPLVSAVREVELVKARVDAIAAEVRREQGAALDYHLGVMVETPRAALRAGDLAASSAFLSFGTNDLTQMTYGLSRDDAGRFMRAYVNAGVFPEDPFHSLDVEGVGELMLIASRRGRARNADLVLGLCGEHGGDPSSVRFCKLAGFDYVSCSPFRVPIARLAAAQATILSRPVAARADTGEAES